MLVYLRDEQGNRLKYEDLVDRSVEGAVADVAVRVAALDDIIASKRFAGRDKDLEALDELDRLRRDRKE